MMNGWMGGAATTTSAAAERWSANSQHRQSVSSTYYAQQQQQQQFQQQQQQQTKWAEASSRQVRDSNEARDLILIFQSISPFISIKFHADSDIPCVKSR